MASTFRCALLVLVLAAGAAHAQETYPTRPIRLVIGFGAGGPTDIPGRFVADKLGEALGQRVVVENKPAAAGMIATRDVLAQPRDGYTLCTKTGVTRPHASLPMPSGATRRRQFDRWDYSARATRASVERSLARLGVERLDIVHLHDVEAHVDACLEAYEELVRLRAEGVVGAIGIGSNFAAPVMDLIQRARFDTFLLAGCYTLLDQSGIALLDEAHTRGMRVVVGGVYNSGLLAAWPNAAATYAYAPADAAMRDRTAAIAAVCARHGVPLAAAALQFAASHPAIATVLIGPRTIAELDANLAAWSHPVPPALWDDLAAAAVIPFRSHGDIR